MSVNNVIDIEIPSIKKEVKPKIKEGIFFDMSNEEYHSLDGLSSTQFQDLDLSVAIYDNRHLFKYDCEAFRIGTLNHTALLEPHLLDRYIETTTRTFDSEATKKIIAQNPDKDPETLVKDFVGVIRGGFEKGFNEASQILQGLGVLNGNVAEGINKTYELVQKGYDDFLSNALSAIQQQREANATPAAE